MAVLHQPVASTSGLLVSGAVPVVDKAAGFLGGEAMMVGIFTAMDPV